MGVRAGEHAQALSRGLHWTPSCCLGLHLVPVASRCRCAVLACLQLKAEVSESCMSGREACTGPPLASETAETCEGFSPAFAPLHDGRCPLAPCTSTERRCLTLLLNAISCLMHSSPLQVGGANQVQPQAVPASSIATDSDTGAVILSALNQTLSCGQDITLQWNIPAVMTQSIATQG